MGKGKRLKEALKILEELASINSKCIAYEHTDHQYDEVAKEARYLLTECRLDQIRKREYDDDLY